MRIMRLIGPEVSILVWLRELSKRLSAFADLVDKPVDLGRPIVRPGKNRCDFSRRSPR